MELCSLQLVTLDSSNWNSQTLYSLQITEIVNQAQVKIKEIYVPYAPVYTAHISKLRLGEWNLNPIFWLPRLPKKAMLQ